MEEKHYMSKAEYKKYNGRYAKLLCDKIAELGEQSIIMDKEYMDKLTEYSIALMERLKRLSKDEIDLLKEYVCGKCKENRDYLPAKNVFSFKEMLGW